MLNYCVDMDDLCDSVAGRSMEYLLAVKEKYPQFTAVTILAIQTGLMNPRKYRNSPVQELRKLSE